MMSVLRSLSASASGTANSQHYEGLAPGIFDLYEVLNAINSMSKQDPTNSEANLIMNLVRAKHEVYQAQKVLADCVARENEMLASLLRFQAEEVEKRLDDMDIGLGCMRVVFKNHGWTHAIPPSCSTRRSCLQGLIQLVLCCYYDYPTSRVQGLAELIVQGLEKDGK
ncbi:hypothetical protein BDR05DRAFT_953049 [Suillus weaverae]|nr:hypothetical protein BDR05DRAFT_953049 [Suillus weaverae]